MIQHHCVLRCGVCLGLLLLSGCAALGVAAHAMPQPDVQPTYRRLAGQSIGVMVWADRGIRLDWGTLQVDLANAVEKKLQEVQHSRDTRKKILKDATYPVEPASIVRYQQDHPEAEAEHITAIAPHLGVTRLIYVEIEDFATRSDMSVDLYRGQAKATVRVIEVDNNGQAKDAYEQSNVSAIYPKKGPREGMPNIGDARVYVGLVDAFATEIAHQFVPYQAEE